MLFLLAGLISMFALVGSRRAVAFLPRMRGSYKASGLIDVGTLLILVTAFACYLFVLETNDSRAAIIITIASVIIGGALIAIGAEREIRSNSNRKNR